MKWRVIDYEAYDPNVKSGLNKVALNYVQQTKQPVFFLSGWKENCINIGYSQKLSEVVNETEAKKRNIRIIRRQGDGGACYLSKDGEITWAIIVPEDTLPKNPRDIFEFTSEKVCKALASLGITAQHKPINDVVTSKGKISGATMKKEGSTVYVSGTLLYSADKTIFDALLKPENDHQKDSAPEKDKEITSVSAESSATFQETITALKNAFMEDQDFEESNWTTEELSAAEDLAKEYSADSWLRWNEQ